jgi:hypothetical protein
VPGGHHCTRRRPSTSATGNGEINLSPADPSERSGPKAVCERHWTGWSGLKMWNTRSRGRRLPRIVGGKIMMPADLKRLHEYMLEVEHIDHILDEMRSVVECEWPEMAHKLPPKAP